MTLVLLPGLMCDERLFGPQVQAWPDSIVVTTTNATTITQMAESVLAAVQGDFAVAGLSMGGIVAMEVVRIAPDRVTKLALLDTNHRAEKDNVRAARLPQIKAAEDGRLAEVMRNEMKPRYLADGPDKPAILDLCMEMATDLGPQVFINQSHALMDRPEQTETLRSIKCPTLILCGAEDQLCPVKTHQNMADLIPNSTLTIIQDAGHLPTLEQPTQTNAALSRWLEAS